MTFDYDEWITHITEVPEDKLLMLGLVGSRERTRREAADASRQQRAEDAAALWEEHPELKPVVEETPTEPIAPTVDEAAQQAGIDEFKLPTGAQNSYSMGVFGKPKSTGITGNLTRLASTLVMCSMSPTATWHRQTRRRTRRRTRPHHSCPQPARTMRTPRAPGCSLRARYTNHSSTATPTAPLTTPQAGNRSKNKGRRKI